MDEDEGEEQQEEGGEPAAAAQGDMEVDLDPDEQPESSPPMEITARVKALVQKLHVNLGHPQTEQFIEVLRAAQSKPEVLEYVRNHFHCDACEAQKRPPERRRVAMPRTFQFNRVLGIDTFFVTIQDQQVPFLNIVCHGTNFQVVARYDGGAKA